MKASILIVSKDRKMELRKTILILEQYISKKVHEVLVFLDGPSDGSEELQDEFPWIRWQVSFKTIGASRSRNALYKTAKGEILIGFDDDSHPLQHNFIQKAADLFDRYPNLGIIAFREIKGIFKKDEEIPGELLLEKEEFLTRDFMGCGFAIKKHVYDKTRGFPEWIDIYGEETCVALEVLDLGFDILYTHSISVNHRVNRELRLRSGANHYRFQKQLKNTTYLYLVFYPFPLLLKKIVRLYFMNFRKYASKDFGFLKAWFRSLGESLGQVRLILGYRAPVSRKTLKKFNSLMNPHY